MRLPCVAVLRPDTLMLNAYIAGSTVVDRCLLFRAVHHPPSRLPGIIFKVDVQPDGARQAEDIHEPQGADRYQRSEGSRRTPAQHPMQEQDEQDAEPAGEDIGNEHRAVVETRLRHEVQLAMGAFPLHVKRLAEAEGPRLEEVLLMAPGTLQAENAVGLTALSVNAHIDYK